MKVPMSWLQALVNLPDGTTTDDVVQALTNHTATVEKVEVVGGELTGPLVIGHILSSVPEPQKNGKIINWCRVDVGPRYNAEGHPNNVEEGIEGRGIVCGAPNAVEGAWVVVSLPGAVLPGGFAISARKTYGHMSDGMLCASDELGIGVDHTGIITLPSSVEGHQLVPGENALPILGVPEEVLDVDVTPDIGYCMSMRGIAREVAHAMSVHFRDPYDEDPIGPVHGPVAVDVHSDDCSQFIAVPVSDLAPDAPTPRFIADRITRAGMRPINLTVDVTNYVMLESGQPLHAYDADKVSGTLVVRNAHDGEHLVTLDDTDRTLDPDDLVIADDSGAIALAGVMGGAATEMTAESTSIILEGAHFDPMTVARAYRRHRLGSEASRRFERGVDPVCAHTAAVRAAELLAQYGGATIGEPTVVGEVPEMPRQTINADLPSRILGTKVSTEEVIEILTRSGVKVTALGDSLNLVAPSWRPDLVDAYDYVEEIGRKIGFDRIEPVLPPSLGASGLTKGQRGRRRVLRSIVEAGFVELITLPFIGDKDLDVLGISGDDTRHATVKLANPLDDTHPYLRTTLLPGLFHAVTTNMSRSQEDLAVFESGTVFRAVSPAAAPRPGVNERPADDVLAEIHAALPAQPRLLAAVICGNWLPDRWDEQSVKADWRHAVLVAQKAVDALGVTLVRKADRQAPWHPGRCAALTVDGKVIGHAGELHPTVGSKAGLPQRTCAVELDLDALVAAAPHGGQVTAISSFPVAKEDVALVVDESVAAEDVREALIEGAGSLLESVELFDVYEGEQVGNKRKSLAFNLRLRAADRTLTDAEAGEARNAAVARAEEAYGAQLRS